MQQKRYTNYSAPVQALTVITLVDAQARYELTPDEVRFVELLLAGKERTLANGLTGYFVTDVEAAIREIEWQ